MIELRWFTPHVPEGWTPIRRLQYRIQLGAGRGYSQWMDVPEVNGSTGDEGEDA